MSCGVNRMHSEQKLTNVIKISKNKIMDISQQTMDRTLCGGSVSSWRRPGQIPPGYNHNDNKCLNAGKTPKV